MEQGEVESFIGMTSEEFVQRRRKHKCRLLEVEGEALFRVIDSLARADNDSGYCVACVSIHEPKTALSNGDVSNL